ncbi:hypothetical protein PVAP13_2NG375203 [Panicum virgatum]|uniref:Uncharacterized protein n=1 Tax=Panicum virgatum TaxID=38727 RepID=A0A8T0VM97_PANVG|nr:hypothetical protein PVAP13_2NG375203 [Panicum virgatum]
MRCMDIVRRLLTCYGVNGSSSYTMKWMRTATENHTRFMYLASWHGCCWTAGCLLVHKLAGASTCGVL